MKTLKIGFTGTRRKITFSQMTAITKQLKLFMKRKGYTGAEFHHGDCVGADEYAAQEANILGYKVVAHPPNNDAHRAFTHAHETRPVKPYIDRNHDIVDEVDIMIVVPKGYTEEIRSGTWATWRYAETVGRESVIIFPDGTGGTTS